MLETDQGVLVMTPVLDMFLRTRQNEHTRRAYATALRELERVTGCDLADIRGEAIAVWVAGMSERGLAAATINQRLSAVGAWLRFLRELGMAVQGVHLRPYYRRLESERSTYLRAEQLKSLLGVIRRDTVQGARDYALMLMFIATGRRCSEIRLLRWGDFETGGGKAFYRWKGKRNSGGRRECPMDVWEVIVDWLNRSGRLEHVQDEDYIFTAISESAKRLPRVMDGWRPGQSALSTQTIGQILRRYARAAGIGGRVHVHMLRHSAAMLRVTVGDNLLEIQDFLGHASVAATQIYLHGLNGSEDHSWGRVKEMLRL